MKYVVFSRGLQRVEGPLSDGCDYRMAGARPIFYHKCKEFDIVSIFCYNEIGLLIERRDYYCLESPADKPLRARKRVVTRFNQPK